MKLSKRNSEIVADELQRLIQSNVLKPGEKLDTIENLAKYYLVGRSTVREALSYLKAHGLVESQQGGGTYVSKNRMEGTFQNLIDSSQHELLQLLQVRKILEVGSIELAAQFRTSENLEELERITKQMRETMDNEELSNIYDVNFHLAIAKASQNKLLVGMMENISLSMSKTMRDSRRLWLNENDSTVNLYEEHHKMLEAIHLKQQAEAASLMAAHFQKVEEVLVKRNSGTVV